MSILTLQSSPDLHIIIILGLSYLIRSSTCFLHRYYAFFPKKNPQKKNEKKRKEKLMEQIFLHN